MSRFATLGGAANAVVTLPSPAAGHFWRIIKMLGGADGTTVAPPGLFISVNAVVSSIEPDAVGAPGVFSYIFRTRAYGQNTSLSVGFDSYGDPRMMLNCVVGQSVVCTLDTASVSVGLANSILTVWAELI